MIFLHKRTRENFRFSLTLNINLIYIFLYIYDEYIIRPRNLNFNSETIKKSQYVKIKSKNPL